MKVFYRSTLDPLSPAAINNIIVQVEYASLGEENIVTVSIINFENDICILKVINVDVFEKKKERTWWASAGKKDTSCV